VSQDEEADHHLHKVCVCVCVCVCVSCESSLKDSRTDTLKGGHTDRHTDTVRSRTNTHDRITRGTATTDAGQTDRHRSTNEMKTNEIHTTHTHTHGRELRVGDARHSPTE